MARQIKYQDDTGETVFLEVPWGFGSGNIPPPVIVFHDSGTGASRTFLYQGEQ